MSERYTPTMAIGQIDKMSHKNKKLDLILLVDTNNNMDGGIVNKTIEEIVNRIKMLQSYEMSDVECVISILTFNEEAECYVEQVKIIDYVHTPIVFNGIRKSYSNAYRLLNDKLTRREFMAHTDRIAQPNIILVTDGAVSSGDNYEPELDRLLENGWFKCSHRFVLLNKNVIDNSRARNTVRKFVSNPVEEIIPYEEIVDLIQPPITIGPGINIQKHNTDVENISLETGTLSDGNTIDWGIWGDFDPNSFI